MKSLNLCIWPRPNVFPLLLAHQLHVWCAMLNYSETQLAEFFDLLTEQEKLRAQRFHFEKDRICFIVTHAILKKLLSGYLKVPTYALRFDKNSHGKPLLVDYPQLQFNLSHSNQVILYAFAFDQAVGIDVEQIEDKHNVDAIAKRFFARREYQLLSKLNEYEKKQAFFKAWTRKEAVLKALGMGLSYSLANIELTTLPTEPAPLVKFTEDIYVNKDWCLTDLSPVDNYAAAVAAQGHIDTIKIWHWQKNIT